MKLTNIEVFSHYERQPWLFSLLGSAALSNNIINCTWKLSSNLCLKLCHLCLVLSLFSCQKEFDRRLGCFYIQCYEKPASKQKIDNRYSNHSHTDISPRPKSDCWLSKISPETFNQYPNLRNLFKNTLRLNLAASPLPASYCIWI